MIIAPAPDEFVFRPSINLIAYYLIRNPSPDVPSRGEVRFRNRCSPHFFFFRHVSYINLAGDSFPSRASGTIYFPLLLSNNPRSFPPLPPPPPNVSTSSYCARAENVFTFAFIDGPINLEVRFAPFLKHPFDLLFRGNSH